MGFSARALVGFAICMLLAKSCLPCRAEIAQNSTIQIDSAAALADPRLERPVSLSLTACPLKLVLDQISTQTGVNVSMDVRDSASGYSVLLQCEKTPAAKLMGGLYSLFSIQRGEWAWTRGGKAGAYTYVLHETPWAKNRNALYRAIMDSLLTNYLDTLREMAPMSMEERKKNRSKLKTVLLVDDDERVNAFFNDEMFWTQAKCFVGALSRAQQLNVLAGNPEVASIESLPADVQEAIHIAFLQMNVRITNKDGTESPAHEPTSVRFVRLNPSKRFQQLAALILIDTATSRRTWMGTGNLEFGVRDAIKRSWMLPGDAADDPIGSIVVRDVPDTDLARAEKRASEATLKTLNTLGGRSPEALERIASNMRNSLSVSARLQQAASGVPVPIIALMPTDQPGGMSTPVGIPLREFLARTVGRQKSYMVKWRSGVVLVNTPEWFAESTTAIPYSLLGALHPDKAGRVPVGEWTSLMRGISDDQAEWFGTIYGVANMKYLRPMLRLVDREANVFNRDGCGIEGELLQQLQSASLLPAGTNTSGTTVRVRVSLVDVKGANYTGQALQLWVQDDVSAKWRALAAVRLPIFHRMLEN